MFMVLVSIIFVFVAIKLLSKQESIMLEWILISTDYCRVKFMVLLDRKSVVFSSIVIIITLSVLTYRKFYISKDQIVFTKLILTFMASIIILIIRPNLVSIVLGWEGLGMSSFVLIMFYQNKKSIISALFTIIMNRVGDATLIIAMIMMINCGSWNIYSMAFADNNIIISLLLIRMFSKRAQIPFSSWLTEAIAAPTPVSALVHSSTLVTAGVYLIIRFEARIKTTKLNNLIFMTSIITLIIARINSVLENDIKKVVALSTLSQLRVIFVSISINIFSIAFYHMLIHAMFKALIFLCRRTIISIRNTQNMSKITSSARPSLITIIRLNTARLVLCRFPFTARFYSKEIIMEMMTSSTICATVKLAFITSMVATIIYSLKLIKLINTTPLTTKSRITLEQPEQIISKFILLTPRIWGGNKINWIMNNNPNVTYIPVWDKIIPLRILAMVIMSSVFNVHTANKQKKVIIMTNYIWFIKTISLQIKKRILTALIFVIKESEKGVIINTQTKLVAWTKEARLVISKNTIITFNSIMLVIVIILICVLCLI